MTDPGAKAMRDLAVRLFEDGKLSEAESLCREILSQRPNDPELLQVLGMALVRLRRNDEAVAVFTQIVRLLPENAWARSNLARALQAAGNVDAAIEAYRQAIGLRPDLAEAVNGLASCLETEGRVVEVLGVWRDAPWVRPGSLGKENRDAESNAVGLAYNMALRRVLAETRVNCVIDVGANVGQFGRHIRELGYSGRLVSMEPASGPYRVLAEAAARDGGWSALQLAAGKDAGEARLRVFPESVYNTLRPDAEGDSLGKSAASETVNVRSLDDLWPELVGDISGPRIFLKVDTQGFDAEVLAGAAARILPASVVLQIEISLRPLYAGVEPWSDMIQRLLACGWGVVGMYPVARLQSDYTTVDMDCLLMRINSTNQRPG